MSAQICLEDSGQTLFGNDTITRYYDHLAKKELEFRADVTPEELTSNKQREIALERIADKENPKKPICEVFSSDIHGVEMSGLFTLEQEIIYGADIRTFIDRLRTGKRTMKREGDPEAWESQFELRLIPLCEFALKNDLGVRLSV
ncbi:hypothetical protein [Halocatena halophila]|uniref:hypothetical protein n=1 Tax=Halocatena halophila TaxID=2814576 RepID=UPI002ED12C08